MLKLLQKYLIENNIKNKLHCPLAISCTDIVIDHYYGNLHIINVVLFALLIERLDQAVPDSILSGRSGHKQGAVLGHQINHNSCAGETNASHVPTIQKLIYDAPL